ncbi:MAG: CRISPR-associated helicase Cas3' [Methanosarcinales archaeon]
MFELYDHQKLMLEPMKEFENALLLAPCGSGKTLAAVYNWLQERPTAHMIYVLPTKTLLKSIEQDIVEILNDKDLEFKIVMLEDKEFGNSNQICIATDYGEKRETQLYAHDIILTTLDSYISRLYRSSLTPKRYRDLPIARILNSTTVFDEAHMYDNYTHTLMRYVLEFLREGNVHHIIMTATMSEKMIEFLKLSKYPIIKVPSEEWMNFAGNKRIKEIVEYKDKNDIADKVKEIIEKNNIRKAMIVCNTVEKAQNIFKKLQKIYNNIILLHSRFKSQDREEHEKEIFMIFEKEEAFIVATQVIEAGLDISFPNLITDVPAGDSLVQRIGRCARRKGENGDIFILYSDSEKTLPYSREDIELVMKLMNGLPKIYNISFEKRLVETVTTPSMKGLAESKARGIILSTFNSLSSFGDSWISVPTRDATPVYLYFGNKIKKDINPMDNSVRVDLRFLYSISKDLKTFTFYEKRYNEKNELEIKKSQIPFAWSIAVAKKSISYDEILGVIKNE